MICNNCKNQVNDGAVFCEFCGAKLIAPQQPMPNQQPVPPQQPGPNPGPQQPAPRPVQGQAGSQPGMNYQAPPQGGTGPQYQAPPRQQISNQGAQQPQTKPGLSTGAIIGIIAGAAVLIILIVVLVVFFVMKKAINDKSTEELTTATTEAEVTTEEATTAAATTEATTVAEVTTEEPKSVPYGEEYGIEFVKPDSSYTVKSVPLFYDADNKLINCDYVDIEKCETTKRFGDILVSKPDDQGMVTYYISYYYDIDSYIVDKSTDTKWWYNVGNWSADLIDYYTGTLINYPNNNTSGIVDEDGDLGETTFEVNGEEVTIKCARFSDEDRDSYVWDVKDVDGGKSYQYNETTRDIMVVKAPASYDGLVLGLTLEDVEYDRYAKASGQDKDEDDEDSDDKDSDDKDSGRRLKVFDDSSDGQKNTKEEYAFLRISDNTKPVKAKRLANLVSVQTKYTNTSYFDWTEKFYNDPKFGGEPITNSDFLGGRWQGYMIWDKDNKLNNYGEELFIADIGFDGSDVTFTFDYDRCKWGEDGEWEDKDEEATHNGTFASDGSIQFEIVDSNFSIQGFYTDGYSQYAIGTMVAQSGETATVFLVRP